MTAKLVVLPFLVRFLDLFDPTTSSEDLLLFAGKSDVPALLVDDIELDLVFVPPNSKSSKMSLLNFYNRVESLVLGRPLTMSSMAFLNSFGKEPSLVKRPGSDAGGDSCLKL